ncbi:histidine phosphatase family protein [Robertmurraya yapensis]|uniref:Histidine phosphatase family protein n=1 Tax=Bacillus yapensis TaxID=2492960 RepID=A0A3S0KF98_9BACI|nr:histidine phosphatase family protein [Bacillus yapensis]RTR29530.1 histidine phosphatase family protein [Bacillus yapensis]TKS94876.1 histidine phosphatase family protein [Bacillus yapensis]
MEIIFIRHGQGEHTLDIPKSFQIKHPSLTSNGIKQVKLLKNTLPLTNTDIIFISPLRRTLQTAYIWSRNVDCQKIVSPLVSPRMFPLLPNKNTLPCDKLLGIETIKKEFPTFELDMNASLDLWANGINILPENKFIDAGKEFIAACKLLHKEKIYIVSHDGTITSYRQLISGEKLTRADFPPETGWVQVSC